MTHRRALRLVTREAVALEEGDELRFCRTCAFAPVCIREGYDKPTLRELHCLVEHVGPFPGGTQIFEYGERFSAIYAVRAGAIKTFHLDSDGREQVLGFYLPGELVGFEAIYPGRYPCSAVCLDTSTLCRFSFPAMNVLARRLPGVQQELLRLMSKHLGQTALLAGDYRAEQRLAAFLIDLARRHAALGLSELRLRLPMTRTDIANYLRLAPETVSRILRRFREQGWIDVAGRELRITDPASLRRQARDMLPEPPPTAASG